MPMAVTLLLRDSVKCFYNSLKALSELRRVVIINNARVTTQHTTENQVESILYTERRKRIKRSVENNNKD